jgi:DNA-binding response OmpR family regulator
VIPTILLVNQCSPDRDDWKAFLQNPGFEVITAENEQTAVRQCVQVRPDLVLLHDTLADDAGVLLRVGTTGCQQSTRINF